MCGDLQLSPLPSRGGGNGCGGLSHAGIFAAALEGKGSPRFAQGALWGGRGAFGEDIFAKMKGRRCKQAARGLQHLGFGYLNGCAAPLIFGGSQARTTNLMFIYVTNFVIAAVALLQLFLSNEPKWLTTLAISVTIAVALTAIGQHFWQGPRSIHVAPSDWQKTKKGDYYFEAKRKFASATKCVAYIVGADGTQEECHVGVKRIIGGFRIESNTPEKLVLEIS